VESFNVEKGEKVSNLKALQLLVDDIWMVILGKARNGKHGHTVSSKPKRARTKKGHYRADDKSTKNINEAYVGGKSPKKSKKGRK